MLLFLLWYGNIFCTSRDSVYDALAIFLSCSKITWIIPLTLRNFLKAKIVCVKKSHLIRFYFSKTLILLHAASPSEGNFLKMLKTLPWGSNNYYTSDYPKIKLCRNRTCIFLSFFSRKVPTFCKWFILLVFH